MIWTLAFRNIRSNIRRSIISILAVAVGLATLIFSGTLRVGQYDTLVHSGVSQLAGHVVVQQKGFQENREPSYILTEASVIQNFLRGEYPEETVTTRTYLGGLLASTSNPTFITLTGIDPSQEQNISDMPEKIIEGEWLTDNTKDILIGHNTAEMLKVDLNDKVVFTVSNNGEMNGQLFRIRGIFKTGSEEIDAFTGFIHYQAAAELLGQQDVAHQVAIHLRDVSKTSVVLQHTQSGLRTENAEILPWELALPDILNMIKVDKLANLLVNFILFTIVALGIVNTMLMSVLERLNQFGVMLAIGVKMSQLIRMIVYEGILLGLIGSMLGIIIGIVVSYPLVTVGIDLSSRVGDSVQIGNTLNSAVLYGKYSIELIVSYALIAWIFSIFATIYPAWKLSTLKPIEAMRHH